MTLESRIGGNMASAKDSYATFSAKDFLKIAKGLHNEGDGQFIEDFGARAKKAEEVREAYHVHQTRIQDELLKKFKALKYHDDLKSEHNKITKAYQKKIAGGKRKLTKREAKEHLEELTNRILPKIGYKGTDEEGAYKIFEAYLEQMKSQDRQMGSNDTAILERDIYLAIQSGNGKAASQKIAEVMKNYTVQQHASKFTEDLYNHEDNDFREAHAKLAHKKVKPHTGELREALVLANLDQILASATKGDYHGIEQQYGINS